MLLSTAEVGHEDGVRRRVALLREFQAAPHVAPVARRHPRAAVVLLLDLAHAAARAVVGELAALPARRRGLGTLDGEELIHRVQLAQQDHRIRPIGDSD